MSNLSEYLNQFSDDDIDLVGEAKLTNDLRQSATLLRRAQVRYLVDSYYQLQGARARANAQVEAQEGEPSKLLEWNYQNLRRLESRYKVAMGLFASEYKVGRWLQSLLGIGPVISAGLLAHFKMRVWTCAEFQRTYKKKPCFEDSPCGPRCMYHNVTNAGKFHSFAGLIGKEWQKSC